MQANRAVELQVEAGTIHGIIGENGAGKSTLMGVLHGFHQADSGDILVHGKTASIPDSRAAARLGIGMVHQHFMLVDRFTVLENVVLGTEGGPLLGRGLARARRELDRLGDAYGMQVDPDAAVGRLAVGAQQRVEILRELYRGADILILDEPTGVLTPAEAADLFRVLRALRAQGRTVLLITHKLPEIMAVTDRVSVMRGGAMVAHRRTSDTSPAELGELMIGRRPAAPPARPAADAGTVVLDADDLHISDDAGVLRVQRATFQVRAGEIVAIAGVAGSGQGELLEALSGMRAPVAGTIRIRGKQVFPGAGFNARAMRAHGVGHVPEDRLRDGLLPGASVADTAVLGHHDAPGFRRFGVLSPGRVARFARMLMAEYDVRPANPALRAGQLSGGNQQRLVLGREVGQGPAVLLVGQPTRGVDIGGIEAVHARLIACRAAGQAVLLVSVELDEVLALADRILVMFEGRIVGAMPAAEATEARLGCLMAGMAEA